MQRRRTRRQHRRRRPFRLPARVGGGPVGGAAPRSVAEGEKPRIAPTKRSRGRSGASTSIQERLGTREVHDMKSEVVASFAAQYPFEFDPFQVEALEALARM